jgi:hypothetical protein
MAWRFDAEACALRATVPDASPVGVTGLSERARQAGFFVAAKLAADHPVAPVRAPAEPTRHSPLPPAPDLASDDALFGGPEPIDLAMSGDHSK